MKQSSCAGIFGIACLAAMTGCLGDAERGNPLDPRSDRFEEVGAVTGLVLNRALQALPEAGVRLVADTSVSRAEFVDWTDEQGQFALREIPIGTYRLSVAKEGYTADDDTVEVAFSQPAEKVVVMEGMPVITQVSFQTVHISRWSTSQDNLYLLDVTADVADPDRASDIEQVWLDIPELDFTYPLEETSDPSRYRKTIPVDSLPTTTLHELLGRALVLKVQDSAGLVNATLPGMLSRIIDETPLTVEPQGHVTVQEAQPVLKWEAMQLPFAFTYRVEVAHIEPNTNLPDIIQMMENIVPEETTIQVAQPLAPGTYYWTVWVVDAFGNRSRSKEAGFSVE